MPLGRPGPPRGPDATSGAPGPRLYLGAGEDGWALAAPDQAVLVLGPPRSGKTSSVVVPNVLAAFGPVLATSTKPDVMHATVAARSRSGRCWLYDPTGAVAARPEGVDELRWSPVAAARDWDRAVVLVRAMVGAARPQPHPGEIHWTERATALLAPLFHAAAISDAPVSDVVSWVNRHDAGPALSALSGAAASTQRPGAGLALDLLEGIGRTDDREASGIWSTASGVLSSYRSSSALASALHPNFEPDDFVRSGDTVYVCAAGSEQAAVGTLVAGLIDAVRDARYRMEAAGAGPAAPVLLALDEAANIAPLPELPALVSEGGGQGVLTLACFQDLSQARWRWGERAAGFLTLFGAKLVLPGVSDPATLEALSTLSGDEETPVRSRTSGGWRRPAATTWSSRTRRRLPPDALRRGRPGSALLLEGAAEPAWIRLTPWYLDQAWLALAGGRTAGPRAVSPQLGKARTARRLEDGRGLA